MDGMFYSLEQTAKKLNKTEAEVNAIVKEGRLRIFFDGPNQLFKVDEIESLLADTSMRMSKPKAEEPAEEPAGTEDEGIALADSEDTIAFFKSSDEQESVSEDIDDIIGLADGEDTTEIAEVTETGADTSADTTEVGDVSESGNEDDFLMLSDNQDESQKEPAAEESVSEPGFEDETFTDLSETLGLSDSTGDTSASTSAEDTTLNGGGINMLGETDGGYELASDTMGETKSASDFDGESLEDIEDDVNLDSFGSGSGLLDLSLQADDTSLGGILDEIYTSDEEGPKTSADTEGSSMDVTAAAEEMFGEGDMAIGEPKANFTGAAMMQGFEPAPDISSNMLGAILILPFIAMIYTTVIVIAGGRGFKPSILNTIEGYISYIFIGFIAVAIVVSLIACFAGGGEGTKKAKVKKEKKPKKKKEKKAKK